MVKIMENPIKMDDLGVPLFLEAPIYFFPFNIIFKMIGFTNDGKGYFLANPSNPVRGKASNPVRGKAIGFIIDAKVTPF